MAAPTISPILAGPSQAAPKAERHISAFPQLIGKTAEDTAALEIIDTVAGVTCSSSTIPVALQNALKISGASELKIFPIQGF